MNYTVLPGPDLPQMSNDGYINSTELLNDGGVIVEVNAYPTAKPGDYINLYWDGRFSASQYIDDPDQFSWPWTVIIAAGEAPDGPHQAYYTVTDVAQNPSASPISPAVVDRNHTEGLPPPRFPDANVNNVITYNSVIANSGTHIHVPFTSGIFAIGNTAYVYWRELDSYGNTVPGSEVNFTHIIESKDMSNGFEVLVPAPYITLIQTFATAQAWYSIVPPDDEAQSSQNATVTVDMTGTASYPAPYIPAGNDGWIDCSEIMADGIEVTVPGNSQFVAGGLVTVFWQGFDASGASLPDAGFQLSHTLSANDVLQGFSITVPTEFILPIGIGYADAWYQASAPSVPGFSAVKTVEVDSEHCTLLPAPVFPDALDDGVIDSAEVEADSGTTMTISYPDMHAGDIVTAFWFGYNSSPASPLPDTSWTQTRTLTSQEAQAQQALFHIAAAFITPIGNGYAQGRYQVMFENGGIASSASQTAAVNVHEAQQLQMSCSTGAPWFDPTVYVRPMNQVTLSGPPGADVILSLPDSSDAFFYPDGTNVTTLRLDETGRGAIQVYCFSTGGITVYAWMLTNPAVNATANMAFTEWLNGNGELKQYGFSTGAIADGKSLCSVYLKTDPSSQAQQARLVLQDPTSARIITSGTQQAWVDISLYHAGSFDVIDSAPEVVNFTLSLPDYSSAYAVGSLTFSLFSALQHL